MMKIDELNLSVRTYNCLRRAKIDTVEQLTRMTDDDLLKLRNFGIKCLAEVREKIAQPKKTNADRIRAMSDDELAAAIYQLINYADPASWFCKGAKGCDEALNSGDDIPAEQCIVCLKERLQQPAEEE